MGVCVGVWRGEEGCGRGVCVCAGGWVGAGEGGWVWEGGGCVGGCGCRWLREGEEEGGSGEGSGGGCVCVGWCVWGVGSEEEERRGKREGVGGSVVSGWVSGYGG